MNFQNDNSISGEWLFGTTRNRKLSAAGQQIYVWRLDLDSNHNPRATNLSIKKLDSGDFNSDSHFVGVKKKMNGNIMSMVYWKSDKKLYYLEFNFSSATVTSILLYNNIESHPFTTFMGSGSEVSRGVTVY